MHFAVAADADLLLLEARRKHNLLEALSFLQSAMRSELAMLLLMLALGLSSSQVTLPDNGPTFESMPSDPASCFTGTYRITGENTNHHNARCSGFKKCEPGFYCAKDNIKRSCPAGRYGQTAGLTSASCSGPCPLGYYCTIFKTRKHVN